MKITIILTFGVATSGPNLNEVGPNLESVFDFLLHIQSCSWLPPDIALNSWGNSLTLSLNNLGILMPGHQNFVCRIFGYWVRYIPHFFSQLLSCSNDYVPILSEKRFIKYECMVNIKYIASLDKKLEMSVTLSVIQTLTQWLTFQPLAKNLRKLLNDHDTNANQTIIYPPPYLPNVNHLGTQFQKTKCNK